MLSGAVEKGDERASDLRFDPDAMGSAMSAAMAGLGGVSAFGGAKTDGISPRDVRGIEFISGLGVILVDPNAAELPAVSKLKLACSLTLLEKRDTSNLLD